MRQLRGRLINLRRRGQRDPELVVTLARGDLRMSFRIHIRIDSNRNWRLQPSAFRDIIDARQLRFTLPVKRENLVRQSQLDLHLGPFPLL